MIDYEEALARVSAIARPLGSEAVALSDAHRRVLANALAARISAPPADVSAMDGYAVRDADLLHLPARLKVVAESFAGHAFHGEVQPGSCVRIFTGAEIPTGADRVVIQENVRQEGDVAIFETSATKAAHIRRQGSDFQAGDIILGEGTWLGPRQLVAAAAADVNTLEVWRQPKLMVLSTGDELTEPGSAAGQDEVIPESVSYGVAALAEEWGASYMGRAGLADRLDELEHAAALALRDADLVVVTGGASVGERDFAKQMFAGQALELIFTKVAIKPGKPVWLGRAGARVVLGLPGNPTSAMVTARLFLAPLLAGLNGRSPAAANRWRKLPLAEPAGPFGDRETFARGWCVGDSVRIASNQDSSAQKTLAACELLVRVRPDTGRLDAGTMVEILDF
jgi:molybdopterin molybdotransferase